MGEEKNAQSPKSWPQVVAVITASISSLTFGMLFTWPSPAIPILTSPENEFRFSLEQCSYLSVISAVTSMVATPVFGILTDRIGRKYTILTMAAVQSISFLLIAFAKNIYVFYLSRIFSGLSDACVFVALPTYVGEITTPKVRSDWGNTFGFCSYLGQVVISVITGYNALRTGALISLVFPIAFAICFSLMPESPYYLIMKGRPDEARNSLKRLLRLKNVDHEMKQLEADVQRQMSEAGTWKDLFTITSNRRALYAGLFLRTAQQFAGLSVFGIYTEYIFKEAGGDLSATDSAIIFFSACTIGNFFASFVMDRMGKRRSVKYSAVLTAIVLAGVGVFFYISLECPNVDVSNFKWVPLVGMLLYVPVFAMGLGIAPIFILSELFSASIKGKGLCALTIFYGFLQCATTKIFQLLQVHCGMYTPFGVFALCTFLTTFLVDHFVPETRGKTLEEIQQELKMKGNKK